MQICPTTIYAPHHRCDGPLRDRQTSSVCSVQDRDGPRLERHRGCEPRMDEDESRHKEIKCRTSNQVFQDWFNAREVPLVKEEKESYNACEMRKENGREDGLQAERDSLAVAESTFQSFEKIVQWCLEGVSSQIIHAAYAPVPYAFKSQITHNLHHSTVLRTRPNRPDTAQCTSPNG